MNKKAKTKTKPKQEETKVEPKNTELTYQKGNGDFLVVQLLTLVCNKLDEMRNHTRVLVEQNDEILKMLKQEDDVKDI